MIAVSRRSRRATHPHYYGRLGALLNDMIMPRIAVCQYLASLSFNQLRIYCCGCVIKDPEYSVPVMMALVWLIIITALIQPFLIDFV
jgi:hypothetical protein